MCFDWRTTDVIEIHTSSRVIEVHQLDAKTDDLYTNIVHARVTLNTRGANVEIPWKEAFF